MAIRSVMYDPQLHQQLKDYDNSVAPEDRIGDTKEYGDTKKFNIREFKKIQDPLDARIYAHRRLQPLGQGSSRAVYVYSPKYALKIATNEAGLYQNELESSISSSHEYDDITARVIDSAPNNIWLISELVSPISFLHEEGFHDDFREKQEFNKYSPVD